MNFRVYELGSTNFRVLAHSPRPPPGEQLNVPQPGFSPLFNIIIYSFISPHVDALAFIFFGPSFGLPEFFFWLRALAFIQPVLSTLRSPCWSRGSLLHPDLGWFRGDVLGRMGRRRCDWSE